jgi:hypothetical protein
LPSSDGWITPFPDTIESLFALCTVTSAWRNFKHEIKIVTKKSYKDLPTAEVLGTNLVGQDMGLPARGWMASVG